MDFFSVPGALPGQAALYAPLVLAAALAAAVGFLSRRFGGRVFGAWTVAWAAYAVRTGWALVVEPPVGSAAAAVGYGLEGVAALGLLAGARALGRRPDRTGWLLAAGTVLLLAVPVAAAVGLPRRLWAGSLAAGAAVAVASGAWILLRHARSAGSTGADVMAGALGVWAVRHAALVTGSPVAGGAVAYALDTIALVAAVAGTALLVVEDLERRLGTLAALSGELQQRGRRGESVAEAVLRRALGLPGVDGSALWSGGRSGGRFTHGAGVASLWPYEPPPTAALEAVRRVERSGGIEVVRGPGADDAATWVRWATGLPVLQGGRPAGVLVVVGPSADPFTALDDSFLLAFGSQVGDALENEALWADLEARTEDLARLQERLVRQLEDERSRLSRELHDETAQVLAAINLQLGVLQERDDGRLAEVLDRARALVREGIGSIRSVTRSLRPTVLDDLGLAAAVRALARDMGNGAPLEVAVQVPTSLPPLGPAAELALYRTAQEALANAVRHASCRRVEVRMERADDAVVLSVADDGRGFPTDAAGALDRTRGGLAGIRERIGAAGGTFRIENPPSGGARVEVRVPAP